MKAKTRSDLFSEKETERRRDEVIRRMANTPPQPNVNPLHGKKKTKAASDHVAHKDREGRER
jgi:hypothetical protein